MKLKVMAWNIKMLERVSNTEKIANIIKEQKADIFVLSEFPTNDKGERFLKELKGDFRYILPTISKFHAYRGTPFRMEKEQKAKLKEGYTGPVKTKNGLMVTIALIRKNINELDRFEIEDIDKRSKNNYHKKEFRWIEVKGELWNDEISIIGVHIPECPRPGSFEYWRYLKEYTCQKDHKLIIAGDMNIPALKSDYQKTFEKLINNSFLTDAATGVKKMKATYEGGTRADRVLLSNSFFDGNLKADYIIDDSVMNKSISDHSIIGVDINNDK